MVSDYLGSHTLHAWLFHPSAPVQQWLLRQTPAQGQTCRALCSPLLERCAILISDLVSVINKAAERSSTIETLVVWLCRQPTVGRYTSVGLVDRSSRWDVSRLPIVRTLFSE